MKTAISRIEEQMKILRVDIQEYWEEGVDINALSSLRARLSGLQTALDICIETANASLDILVKARDILSCELTDKELLELISKVSEEKEINNLVDYVEGIQVCEKLEYEYTCYEFLEEIGFSYIK